MSTAPAWVALSGVKSEAAIAVRGEEGIRKSSKPAPAGPVTTRLPRGRDATRCRSLLRVMNMATLGARVITERIGIRLSHSPRPRTAK
jgi:hypothetical protein